MDNKEFRVLIKHCFLMGKNIAGAKQWLDKYYGDSAPRKSTITDWYVEFKRSRTIADAVERSGRSKSAVVSKNIRNVEKVVSKNRKIKLREISDTLDTSRSGAYRILDENLGMCNLFSMWMPCLLTAEQEQQHVDDSERCLRDKDDFKYAKMDQTWMDRYKPELKRSADWTAVDESRPKRPKTQKSAGKIRVGKHYQAVCPKYIPTKERKPKNEIDDRAVLVWSPSRHISEEQFDEYIRIAKEKYGYNGEQALGMLFWHKHNLDRAVFDLSNFTPCPDEWSVEDKDLFEQAFAFHGKVFHNIRQMLPDKSLGSLVKYYYSWKKTRASLMNRQARKLEAAKEMSSEQCSNTYSENEEKKENGEIKEIKIYCSNCGIPCTVTKTTPTGVVCSMCYMYCRKTRKVSLPVRRLRRRDIYYNVLKDKNTKQNSFKRSV